MDGRFLQAGRRHPANALSALAVRKLGPGRYADGGGLYLHVDGSGARRFFLRVMRHGRRRDIGLGSAADVPLTEARDAARALRQVVKAGGDPIAARDRARRTTPTFEEAARRAFEEQIRPGIRSEKRVWQWMRQMELHVFPKIGRLLVSEIASADVLYALKSTWQAYPEVALKNKQRIKNVLSWATVAGLREGANPVDGVEAALPKQTHVTAHHKALPWRELPALMRRLATCDGVAASALRFTILTAARQGEVRGATWSEISFEDCSWVIPAARMKARRTHRVPLSEPALALLVEARGLSERGVGVSLFAGAKTDVRRNAVRGAEAAERRRDGARVPQLVSGLVERSRRVFA